MTISIETKILSKEENKTVVSMLKAVYGEYDVDFSTHKNILSFLAKDNEHIIGHAATVKQQQYSELRGFVVNPTYRYRGIGTLIEAARTQHILNDHSIELVHGDIATINEASQLLKESIGFKAIGSYLGSASLGEKQRTCQIPAFWDVRESIKNSHKQFWIPRHYHRICEHILRQFGTTYISINDNDSQLTGTTNSKTDFSFGASKSRVIPGADLEEAVTKLSQGEHKWLGITLDATQETTPEAVRRLNKQGFFYAALMPTGTIALQKLLNQEINTSLIPVIEPYKHVFSFIAQEYNKL